MTESLKKQQEMAKLAKRLAAQLKADHQKQNTESVGPSEDTSPENGENTPQKNIDTLEQS